ncbi:hypothetical protein SADUNF_Sadunf03G0082000 [Salix dunnii]|uniref:Uncharacterized protein n=1 Tax=Salix dunnii TaxID=1413687 RepID=A0A835KDP9_9ROSI|nr:hypothetical protein SADUNF_Sadunf03G0082000 [Salix dunnii]
MIFLQSSEWPPLAARPWISLKWVVEQSLFYPISTCQEVDGIFIKKFFRFILIHLLVQSSKFKPRHRSLLIELLGSLIEVAGGKGHEVHCMATRALACKNNDEGTMHRVEKFALESQFLA